MLNKHDVAVIEPAQSYGSAKCMCIGSVKIHLILFCAALRRAVLTHALQHCFAALLHAVNTHASHNTNQQHYSATMYIYMTVAVRLCT